MGAAEAVFWGCAAGLGWSWAGYPLAMGLLGALRGRATPGDEAREPLPMVSLVLPCHDEGRVLRRKLEECLALDYPAGRLELLVVSDGAGDDTPEIARAFAAEGVRLVERPLRRGKAAAINAGVRRARGEVVVLSDAPERLRPDALRRLVAPFCDPTVGGVSGRGRLAGEGGATARGSALYQRYESWLRGAEGRAGTLLGFFGPLCAFRRALFRPLPPDTILDDDAIPLALALGGARVVHAPRAVAIERPTASPRMELRRRLRYQAGTWQLVERWPRLANPFGGMLAFQFISHRLLRALEPWLHVGLLGAAAALAARPFYAAVLALQLGACAAAVLGYLLWRSQGRSPPGALALPLLVGIQNLAAAAGPLCWASGHPGARWAPAREK